MLLLVGCGTENKIKIEKTHEVGVFSVDILVGWRESPFYMGGTYEIQDDAILVYDISQDTDNSILNNPWLSINYKTVSCDFKDINIYGNSILVDDVVIDDITFKGFAMPELSYPFSQYVGQFGEGCLDIIVMQDREEGTITINDEDVQTIIASIELTN